MKILQGILIVILAFVPWTIMFTYHLWIQPVIGDTGGQLAVGVVAAIVLALGIYATSKGYGRQEPDDTPPGSDE